MVKLGAKQLREKKPTPEELAGIKRNPIFLVLDNVLDTYNIGSLFRLADAVAAERIYLCGQTETPPSSRIHKAAVGTENWVPWEHFKNPVDVVKKLRKNGVQIVAVEQHERARSFKSLEPKFPVAVVVGHETAGVSKEILDLSDVIVELPMFGVNKSLNVMVSGGIVLYEIASYLES